MWDDVAEVCECLKWKILVGSCCSSALLLGLPFKLVQARAVNV